jgi:hypothetical protein
MGVGGGTYAESICGGSQKGETMIAGFSFPLFCSFFTFFFAKITGSILFTIETFCSSSMMRLTQIKNKRKRKKVYWASGFNN